MHTSIINDMNQREKKPGGDRCVCDDAVCAKLSAMLMLYYRPFISAEGEAWPWQQPKNFVIECETLTVTQAMLEACQDDSRMSSYYVCKSPRSLSNMEQIIYN